MKNFVLAALAVTSASASVDSDHFKFMQFCSKYSKSYSNVEEYMERMELFLTTEATILIHNANGNHSYTLDHNRMSDWTVSEY